ncbi:amino acid adenylation domain-containing protein [Paenibacillus sp. SYP-B3998]|uniref:Amino acid adenylation domain-containing protein n=1 Tax=Paenibacillus sp. SYP-B3998 TaxID=2678564 RepID=A0A6G3ZX82_9BACL|nr:non-ribosomal peptide synthetase [Paenibacillus sp. SYP-B3998]NEW06823.1 amino acid adenylation domain-containing protein [Paenibacillus sp. SYP-B3998]
MSDNLSQHILLASGQFDKEKQYWLQLLQQTDVVSGFPKEELAGKSAERTGTYSQEIPLQLIEKIDKIANKSNIARYMILLSGIKYLLSAYTGEAAVIVGMPIFAQQAQQEELLNPLVLLKTNYDSTLTFKQWLGRMKETVLAANEHQNFSFAIVAEHLQLPKTAEGLPTCSTIVRLDAIHDVSYQADVGSLATFSFLTSAERLTLQITYETNHYSDRIIQQIANHFEAYLEKVLNEPDTVIGDIELLSEAEREQILVGFNEPSAAEETGSKTFTEMFEQQVMKTPEKVALVVGEEEWTYAALNAHANRLARLLQAKGVQRETIVGIMARRSADTVIGVLAVMKAGGAYLPIDPTYPLGRISYLLRDSQAQLLLTQRELQGQITELLTGGQAEEQFEAAGFSGDVLYFEDACLEAGNSDNLGLLGGPEDLAYVIYTSGTTGNPKGVMIEHRSFVNVATAYRTVYQLNQFPVRLLQMASFSFDVFSGDLARTFVSGGQCVLCPEDVRADIPGLVKLLQERGITIFESTPALITPLFEYVQEQGINLHELQVVIVSSDSCSVEEYDKLQRRFGRHTRILNVYGVTEASIDTSYYEEPLDKLPGAGYVPIGKPMPNMQMYVVNGRVQLQPIGVPGELVIGGAGVARGYYRKPELSAEKFIANPFVSGEKLYRTGDLVRWMPDGNIEYLGRIDNQVQLRGYRVELGEVESRLLQIQNVREAVAIIRDDQQGERYLCAYVVAGEELAISAMRETLAKSLPHFMIPSYFVRMDQMPLTPNGKVDRKALPAPDRADGNMFYVAPVSELEDKLAVIWQDVLRLERVGICDNFFEIGGHSLKATALVSRIHQELKVNVPLREVFLSPTVEGLAKVIATLGGNEYTPIPPTEKSETYPVSSAQKRIYLLHQLDTAHSAYNMPNVLLLEGRLDRQRLEHTFTHLVERHASLRTSFELSNGELVQRVHSQVHFDVNFVEDEENEVPTLIRQFIRPFDLASAPLYRVSVICIGEQRHILLTDIHHIVSDGVSLQILEQEFYQHYKGISLPEHPLTYVDYAVWQQKQQSSKEQNAQEAFWLEAFSGELAVLELPTDEPRPAVRNLAGKQIICHADAKLTEALRQLAQQTGTTLYMVLLSAFSAYLSRIANQEEIIVGTVSSGRSRSELANIVGMFVNTLAIRSFPEADKSFSSYLYEVKQTLLSAYEHQDYPFEDLVRQLGIQRDPSRTAIFDAMFTMEEMLDSDSMSGELSVSVYPSDHPIAQFDLTMTAMELEKDIAFRVEYSSALFHSSTVERWVKQFLLWLGSITQEAAMPIGRIEVLSDCDKHQLLVEFNQTKSDISHNLTIHGLFEEQAELQPNHPAVICGEVSLTFAQLNQRANRLARILREKGVTADRIVGIMVERSVEMNVGLLGILKAGGAYLPIDPSYPDERIKYLLTDSGAELLITQTGLQHKADFSIDMLFLDVLEQETIGEVDRINLEPTMTPNHLAYVIYTSGTTGMPKGVMVEHRSVMNYLTWRIREYGFNSSHRMVQLFSFAFDGFLSSFFAPLLAGSASILLEDAGAKDPLVIRKAIIDHGVTHFMCVPSLYAALMECMSSEDSQSLKIITLGGEAVQQRLVNQHNLKYGHIELTNEYGPTENSIGGSILRNLQLDKLITIGRPITNNQMYILNADYRLSPIGVVGELCIGGAGLTRGYRNQPELTAAKFVANPYVPGTLIYKTGDLAKWLPDGRIEYMGRADEQVKIRGYRIELTEIQSGFLQIAGVNKAVVTVLTDDYDVKHLCAYFTADEFVTTEYVRNSLTSLLPNYMIPSYFVKIDSIPLTSNGKVDRKLLPIPNLTLGSRTGTVAPRTPLEEELVRMWEEILEIEPIGIQDNFFELGGHSLKAMMLVARVYKRLQLEVALTSIFQAPTIEALAHLLQSKHKSGFTPIVPAQQSEVYPVSSAQKRLYILRQLEGAEESYNMPAAFLIENALDAQRLNNAFIQLMDRHESLRTSFVMVDGEPFQRIHTAVDFQLAYGDAMEEEFHSLLKAFVRPFELDRAPLWRGALYKVAEDRCMLLMDMHHIISDGVSMNLITEELFRLYNGEMIQPLSLQYKDYACWQQEMLQSEAMDKQEAYWLNSLLGQLPVLSLPTDYPHSAVQSFIGGEVEFTINREVTADLYRIGQKAGATLFMVLFAAYNAFLSRIAGQEEMIMGTVISGRPSVELEGIVGMFVNTLAIRTFPEGDKSFTTYLQEVKQTLLSAYENQDYPFEELVKKRVVQRDMSRNPLFDTMFTLTNKSEDQDHGVRIRPFSFEHSVTQFELTLSAVEGEDTLSFSFEYSAALFKRETIERWKDLFSQWLTSLTSEDGRPIAAIDLLTPQEKQRLLIEFNDTAIDYPVDKTVHQLFEDQVERTPDHIALKYGTTHISYRALNDRANRLARALRHKGVKPETVVAIMEERSVDMIVGVLAVLKAGGAYVPIDPDYPQDRIDYMLEDSKASIILTKSRFLQDRVWDAVVLDLAEEALYAEDGSNLERVTEMHHLAYFIYTSGSTGKPKGVMNEHCNLAAYLYTFIQQFHIDHRDTVLHLQSVSFDGAVDEMYLALLCGGTVCIANKTEGLDTDLLEAIIERENITVLFCSSLLLSELNQRLSVSHPIRLFYPGGDVVKPSYYSNFTDRLVYNMYGPTEATVTTTYYNCLEPCGHNVPIGKPMPNKQVYILGPQGQVQPIGVPGELYVAGVGLARGYLNQPELTEAKFVANSFVPGERMYRTGDFARWLPDGNVEYLGRMDQQVKIRGYRVELGEIEAQLHLHKSVDEAIVLADESPEGDKLLVAYIVAEDRQTNAFWRQYLARSLPYFMVPSVIIQLDEMPLTPNGKIDRKALISIRTIADEEAAYSAPLDTTEVKLVAIWEDILGRDRISRTDHFFELGGHSLKAMAVVKQVYQQFQVHMPLSQVFKLPVLHDQAMYIRSHEASVYTQIDLVEKRDVYQLSSAQKRMYILHQMQPTSIVYNMPDALLIEGNLDFNQMEQALRKLIQRHESLRTSFIRVETEPMQRIDDEVSFVLTYRQLENVINSTTDIEATMAEMMKTFVQPFDLKMAPLFRAELIQLNPNQHILLLDMHHITSDGMSNDILMDELGSLYSGEHLPELPLHYKDYSVWQNKLTAEGELDKQEAYWLSQFAGSLPVIQLPTDHPRPKVSDNQGDSIQFSIDEALTMGLRRLAAETGATLNMVLLAGYTLLFHIYSGQEDIVVGTPVAGRLHPDLDKIVGMFVNTLAIRSQPSKEHTILSFIYEVKRISLQAYENQSYPFEDLVKKVVTTREANRNPLFDAMFTLQSADTDVLPNMSLPVQSLNINVKTVKVDLTLTAKEINSDGMIFDIEYATALFERHTVQRMGRHLVQIMNTMVNRPSEKLSNITMIDAEEKQQVLEIFNNTKTDYPRHQSLISLFEEQVEKSSEQVAVVFGDDKLTYRELNQKSNQVAGELLDKGIQPGGIIAILMDRSIDMITAILAVLKTGNAYLPIDPEYPQERIQYMLQDSGSRCLLTIEALFSQTTSSVDFLTTIIMLDAMEVGKQETLPVIVPRKGSDLAYVMYTSGTTGKPKGIMTTQANITRVVKGTNYIEIGEDDVVASLSNYAFDGFTFDFFGALLNGATLVIVQKTDILDINQLSRILIDQRITVMFVTTALFNLLVDTRLDSLTHLRKILFGGERVSVNHMRKALAALGAGKLLHMYGPTESTVYATFYPVDEIAAEAITIPIGKPLSNTEAYILGAGGQLMPIGITGELCLAGDGLALGYLNLPEMTAEKFVVHPLESGRLIYKTGDLARFLPDGNIEFIDRIDHQVKIRGHRIELGEIESRLLELHSLKEATVLLFEKAGEKSLCAYYVTDSLSSISEIREELTKSLPEYMIPAYFVPLAKMPLTPNGKIDRRALPEPTLAHAASHEQAKPQNKMEEQLVAIWMKVLAKDTIGIHDNFFEIGGHSLLATKLAFDIFDEFKVKFPLVEIFNHPTVHKLAEFVGTLLPAEEERERDEQLLLLKEGTDKNKHLFFIHAGDGEAEPYVPFSRYLSESFQCWAIKVASLQDHEPVPLSIEELARSYVDKIRKVQPEGSYYLAGWSIGGTIAFEIARCLEELGFTVGFIGMFDSPFVQGETVEGNSFEQVSEMKLLANMFAPFIHSPLVSRLLEHTVRSEQVWHTFLTLAEKEQVSDELLAMLLSNKELIASMPEVENCKSLSELVKIYNVCRSLTYARDHYVAANRIEARLDFFQASTSPVENMGAKWRDLSAQPVIIHEVVGDHYSMFRMPLLHGLASTFDRVLMDTVFAYNRE